ncbi:MAG: GNAT family N-acetyltransferase [Gallicola sp.]|nr:GNAT family N-acetyltransferase [Gallicola sp.]
MDYKYMEEKQRVVALDGDKEAGVITYNKKEDTVWIFDHTYVEPQYRGGPIASTLLKTLTGIAKEKGVKVIAQCSYVKRKFDQNPEYKELEYKG